jgi:hypothetical protein
MTEWVIRKTVNIAVQLDCKYTLVCAQYYYSLCQKKPKRTCVFLYFACLNLNVIDL